MRIVSLLASATEIVCTLGLEDRLVGISHECDHPPEVLDRPRVSRPRFDPEGLTSREVDEAVRGAMAEHGSVYEIDGDALGALDPDLVLTQAVCDVCAVPTSGVRDLVEERALDARVLSLDAHSLEEILASVQTVGDAAGVPDRGRARRRELESRLATVAETVEDAPRPRLLAVEWTDPPFVPGHWVPQMIERAGAVNLAGEPRERSRQVEWADLEGLDPDVLVVMPCGLGLEEARADADEHAAALARIAPRAIDAGRAWVVDASAYFNRSGPRVVAGVEILGGLLHPDRVPSPPADAADRWEPSAATVGEESAGEETAGEEPDPAGAGR